MNALFFIVLIIDIVLFALAEKYNKKVFLIIGIILISLLSGLRGISVGVDTPSYYNAFIYNFPNSWQFEELGFRYITRFLMSILKNPTMVMLVYSFIINTLIILRLWDYRDKCSFKFMTVLYILIFFIDSMNIMRQFLAISIIFYSTKFLEKKNYFPFIIIVLLATTIHKSSILALFIPLVYFWISSSKKNKVLLAVPLLIISTIVLNYIFSFESDHISNYLSSKNYINNFNFTYLYRLCIFGLSFFLMKNNKKIVFRNEKKDLDSTIVYNETTFKVLTILYLCGLLLASMGMFFNYMQRIGYIFLIYELLYWGFIIRRSKSNFFNISLIHVYAIYVFMIEIIRNGSSIFPYYLNI